MPLHLTYEIAGMFFKMILFKDSSQFLLIPTFGIVRDGKRIDFVFSWLCFGMAMMICELNITK